MRSGAERGELETALDYCRNNFEDYVSGLGHKDYNSLVRENAEEIQSQLELGGNVVFKRSSYYLVRGSPKHLILRVMRATGILNEGQFFHSFNEVAQNWVSVTVVVSWTTS